jgi:hypothetical protein
VSLTKKKIMPTKKDHGRDSKNEDKKKSSTRDSQKKNESNSR